MAVPRRSTRAIFLFRMPLGDQGEIGLASSCPTIEQPLPELGADRFGP